MVIFNRRGLSYIALCTAALGCVACEGYIDAPASTLGPAPAGGGASSSGGTGLAGSSAGAPPDCAKTANSAPLPTRVRRLTPVEYTSTLQALVGPNVPLPAVQFPPDATLGVFHNAAALLRVTDLLADELAEAARKLANSATAQLPALLGCDPSMGDEAACVRGFLTSFGAKAYRRPVSGTELSRLFEVYTQGRREADARAGVALALEVIFQSPNLLYRTELGVREGTEPEPALTPYELASELSYLLTLGPPDSELTRAAGSGELSTPEAREAQARRLLLLPSGRTAMAEFASEWLDIGKLPALSKDAALFPGFSAEQARSMQSQTKTHFASVMFEGDGQLRSLLLGGLLTEPSVLAAHAGSQWSSPTHRGKMIVNQLLCQHVPPPPPGLIVTIPPAVPGATTRQRMLTHASDPGCASCHQLMDPLGFAFEHYDAVGAYRADEGGLVIDASGLLAIGSDADGPFDGAQSLAQRLADSADVRSCFAKQWTTFAVGGDVDEALACSLQQAFAEFRADTLSLPELLIRVVRSDAFVKRHVSSL